MRRATATAIGLAGLTTTLAFGGVAEARDQIRIVGSSTVYPFSTAVAEQFGNKTSFPTPVVESTGSGGGLKLFCTGVGEGHPDVTNASRRIKQSEVDSCAANGITEITEVKVGFDGIVLANSKESGEMDLTLEQLWLALAKDVPVDGALQANPYRSWSDIDPSLPDVRIEVLGPPPTSGTRDAFVELAMDGGCGGFEEIKMLEGDAHAAACRTIREDGAFVEAGENDNLIVQKLQANPAAFGILGFSFLDQNMDVLQGSRIEGVPPAFEDIADGNYPISRSLYFYIKNAHVGVVPGLKEYVEEFTSDAASGEDGYLADKGLIPLPDDARAEVRDQAVSFTPLTM
jgi:phosphate transport system substrate-binding protein